MRYVEELWWILDKIGGALGDESLYRENIEFVHSLGLKCDCVGWCKMRLGNARTEEILDVIAEFCEENGWQARGLYFRNYEDVQSDWYELVPRDFQDSTDSSRIPVKDRQGGDIHVAQLLAYHESSHGPKYWRGEAILVSDRFRRVCLKYNIPGLEFCWAKDVGKYAAEQYFHAYGTRNLDHIAVDRGLCRENWQRIEALGGWLPRIAAQFYRLQQINLQDCYLKSELPEGGIVAAYCPRTYSYSGRNKLLIHKNTAEILLREKAVFPADLRPAVVVEELPGGYLPDETQIQPRPTVEYMEAALKNYEDLKAVNRPVRQVKEKEALKSLRWAKRQRKEDFRRALPKAQLEAVAETAVGPLVPYYQVTAGGYLSDEYKLLSWNQALETDEEFQTRLAAEEQLEAKPQGVVIGKCPDGDAILLCADGTVARFSHEAPEVTDSWPTLAQFIFDAVMESD